MKKLIALSGLILILSVCSLHAQVVTISALNKNTIIEIPGGDITLKNTTVTLDNGILKCKTFTIDGTVTKLRINGTTEVSCTDLRINATNDVVIDPESSGTLIIEYTGTFTNTNNKSFKIDGGQNLKIVIVKK